MASSSAPLLLSALLVASLLGPASGRVTPVNALNERALDELNTIVDHLGRRDDLVAVREQDRHPAAGPPVRTRGRGGCNDL